MANDDRVLAELIENRMLSHDRFSVDEVRSWMRSANADLRGAAYDILRSMSLVGGEIDREEANSFIVDFLIWSMTDASCADPATVFVVEPHLAGHELCAIYRGLRRGGAEPSHPTLARVREELQRLYLHGSADEKDVVVNGALEHLFEDELCRSDFSAWNDHPELAKAAEAADAWAGYWKRGPSGSSGG